MFPSTFIVLKSVWVSSLETGPRSDDFVAGDDWLAMAVENTRRLVEAEWDCRYGNLVWHGFWPWRDPCISSAGLAYSAALRARRSRRLGAFTTRTDIM